jgi:hypothetical protein
MKHLLLAAFCISISLLFLTACSKDDDEVNITPTIIENNLMTGSWRVDLFRDSGDDETDHFAGFAFSFEPDHVLIATNGPITHVGTWSVTGSQSGDDSPGNIDVNIFFATPAEFEDLIDDWGVILHTDDRLELLHSSGGNGGMDVLHFEKI